MILKPFLFTTQEIAGINLHQYNKNIQLYIVWCHVGSTFFRYQISSSFISIMKTYKRYLLWITNFSPIFHQTCLRSVSKWRCCYSWNGVWSKIHQFRSTFVQRHRRWISSTWNFLQSGFSIELPIEYKMHLLFYRWKRRENCSHFKRHKVGRNNSVGARIINIILWYNLLFFYS